MSAVSSPHGGSRIEVFLLPVLRALVMDATSPRWRRGARVATAMGLDEADLAERLPNSPQLRATNRINWAQILLQRAGLLERLRRGVYKVTDRGPKFSDFAGDPDHEPTSGRYPEFREWRRADDDAGAENQPDAQHPVQPQTPDEALDSAFR